jgi:hypothetical protein
MFMDENSTTKKGPHLLDEADVGSGEKSPGQQDTEALIDRIGERPSTLPAPGTTKDDSAAAPASTCAAAQAALRDPDLAVAPGSLQARPADSASAGPP